MILWQNGLIQAKKEVVGYTYMATKLKLSWQFRKVVELNFELKFSYHFQKIEFLAR